MCKEGQVFRECSAKPTTAQDLGDRVIPEVSAAAQEALETGVTALLQWAGEDVTREGLVETPSRVFRAYKELLTPEPFNFTTFEAQGYDEMICELNVPFFTLCEHHLMPFFGTCSIAYLPKDRIVGISKLARAITYFSHRVNTQEYLTQDIAKFIEQQLNPLGVAVVMKARHTCQIMRGAKTLGEMGTSCMRGVFLHNSDARAEFLAMLK